MSEAGYRCARVSASGQRRGARRDERLLAGDIIGLAVACGPHLLVEVGGIGKRLARAFAELRESILPGFAPLVIRFVCRKRWYYTSEDDRFGTFDDALESLRGT